MSRFKAPRVERGSVCSVDQIPYLEKTKEKQNEDIGTRQTIQNLIEGDPITEPEYKDFAKQLFVSQGILFQRFEGTEKVVIPTAHAEEFITETHLDPIIKHMGAQKIIGRIQDYAYVKFLSKLAHKVVKNCGRCIQNRTLPTSDQHAPIQDPDYPKCIASHWHVDHTGPITQGDKTFYIRGGIDAFSKYLVTGVSETKTAKSAFKYFGEKILFRFGVPDRITSDQGGDFVSYLIDHIRRYLKIRRITTSPYHPQSNGQIERTWRTVKNYPRNMTTNYLDIKDWIPAATFAYNSAVSASTGFTPNYLRQEKFLQL